MVNSDKMAHFYTESDQRFAVSRKAGLGRNMSHSPDDFAGFMRRSVEYLPLGEEKFSDKLLLRDELERTQQIRKFAVPKDGSASIPKFSPARVPNT